MSKAIDLLVEAVKVHIDQGHYTTYEGLEDCPAIEYKQKKRTFNLHHCDCGIVEAIQAIDECIAEGLIDMPSDWDKHVR